jgi:hypothetical protein
MTADAALSIEVYEREGFFDHRQWSLCSNRTSPRLIVDSFFPSFLALFSRVVLPTVNSWINRMADLSAASPSSLHVMVALYWWSEGVAHGA